MANFDYTRPQGVWTDLSTLDASELADFDRKIVKAPNFAEGGSYAPSAVVTVGGAGMVFSSRLLIEATGSLMVGGDEAGVDAGFYVFPSGLNARVYTDLDFAAQGVVTLGGGHAGIDMNKDVKVLSKLSVLSSIGQVFSCGGGARFGGDVSFEEDVSVAGRLDVLGALGVAGAISAQAGITVSGAGSTLGGALLNVGNLDGSTAVQFFSPITFGGQGRLLRINDTFRATAQASYSPFSTQSVVIPPNQLTQNVTITLLNTNARNGDVFSVANNSATYDVLVQDNAGNVLATVWANHWGEFEFVGGAFTRVKLGSFLKHGTAD